MKKSLFPLLFCLLFSFACQESDDPATACGVSDPIENIAWLKQLAEESATGGLAEFSYIAQAKYKGKRVFYWGSCCPNCSWALVLRNCDGNRINDEISFDDLEDTKVIWQHENSQCNF
ncbi:hypothetical protein SYJ56_06895 [Algoriphagus sp. D3-2-R+10]|uniref:hypothetical protein n=1 Tax=Algoriphagus aurantiacus TaxID=3103948 RepID=UPI002B36DBCC|nr:hypothetical protein [Algoriphagus sp. D3-2-R+10]MEB2775026.1 hypothetical protein [Algoriphagus sp. D3-2-R+10]